MSRMLVHLENVQVPCIDITCHEKDIQVYDFYGKTNGSSSTTVSDNVHVDIPFL